MSSPRQQARMIRRAAGALWLGLLAAGLPALASLTASFEPAFEPADLPTVMIRRLVFDAAGTLFVATADEWLVSTDGGQTFAPGPDESTEYELLAADPHRPGVLYAGRYMTLERTGDGGSTWESVLPGCAPLNLVVAPSNSSVLFVQCGGGATHPGFIFTCLLFRSDDGGATFTRACSGLPGATTPLAVDPVDPRVVYVTSFMVDPNYNGDNEDAAFLLFRSDDGGDSWHRVSPALPSMSDLAIDPLDPRRLYAASWNQGIFVSRDRGATWQPGGLDAGIRELEVDPVNAERLYVRTTEGEVAVSHDSGATWRLLEPLPPAAADGLLDLAVDPVRVSELFVGTFHGLYRWSQRLPGPCRQDERTVCLSQGRFEAQAAWRDFAGGRGPGRAGPVAGDSAYLWFFHPANLELTVKVIDGRVVNDRFWVFFGSLSNVPYTLVVRDTESGEVRGYRNPERTFASVADTEAFPLDPAAGAGIRVAESRDESEVPRRELPAPAAAACEPGDDRLCLGGDAVSGPRFLVEVDWQDFTSNTGEGRALPLTRDSGSFWFFRPDNVELTIKVIDGRRVNGHFWVFFASLTNVSFSLRVTDLETQRTIVYDNPEGHFASRGDTAAFSDP